MNKLARSVWKSIKRNPVLLVAVITILAEAGQKALADGHFTFTVWMTYALQMAMAWVAREFVVPYSEHKELADKVSEAIVESNLKRFTND